MRETPARLENFTRPFALRWSVVLFVLVVWWGGGCGARRRPTITWSTAVQVRPALQPQAAPPSQIAQEPAPEFDLEVPPFAALLIPVRSGPVRPHVSAPAPVSSVSEPEKTVAPMIAPQLSAQETAAAQLETNQSLGIAEKNLGAMRGKNLNAVQADLVSKINGFLKDAREAAQAGDWSRARSLAKKAQVLSEELTSSP